MIWPFEIEARKRYEFAIKHGYSKNFAVIYAKQE